MGKQWRKVYVEIVLDVGLDAAYILDALINARNFQNTNEVVFTKSDAEKIGIARYPFEKAISALEKAGYVARIPASKPMRFVIYDKTYKSISTDSDPSYKSISTDRSQSYKSISTDRKVDISLSKSRNDPSYESISTDTTIKRKENNRELVESKNINNNQLEENIFSFFQSRNIGREEAERFIQYNRQHYGDSRLTPDNYEELAKMWIHNMKRKPKKKESASDRPAYKTAGQVAEERGCSVEEVIGSGKIQPIPQKKYDEIPGDIMEMFGGGES